MTFAPLLCEWTGDSFRPLGRYASKADRQLVVGERYKITEWSDRSDATHRHEFAWLREAWQNLPESIADLYPSPEHLRKRALIQAGYFNEMVIDAGSNAAAIRVSRGFMAHDEFCVAVVRGTVVAVRTAKSQSRRSMDRKEFQASKTAIMEVVAQMIGVLPADLERNAERAA